MLSTALFRILRQFSNDKFILFVQMLQYLVSYKQVINVKLPAENYQSPALAKALGSFQGKVTLL